MLHSATPLRTKVMILLPIYLERCASKVRVEDIYLSVGGSLAGGCHTVWHGGKFVVLQATRTSIKN